MRILLWHVHGAWTTAFVHGRHDYVVPVVPAARWAPYGVPTVLLGDQSAPCRDTRARECPVPGHPCLSSVTAHDVVTAVEKLSTVQQPAVPHTRVAAGKAATDLPVGT